MKRNFPQLLADWVAASRALEMAGTRATAVLHADIPRAELRELFSDDVREQVHVRHSGASVCAIAGQRCGDVSIEVWARIERRELTREESAALDDAGRDCVVLDVVPEF